MSAYITGIKIHNICQYTDRELEIRTGLNAVTGPNGSGKSNLCRALLYGLTGLVDGLWGTQQNLQKDGTADPGYVEVGFVHDGKAYRIRRYSASGRTFPDFVEEVAGGKKVAIRNAEVNAFMAEVFGMPVRLMFQVCWARQGELAQLLTAPAAIVGELLSQVFDTRRLEKLREKLKLQIDTIAVPAADCKERLCKWTASRDAVQDLEPLQKAYDDAVAAQMKAQGELSVLNERLHGGSSRLAATQLAAIKAELERLAAIKDPVEDDMKLIGDDPDQVLEELKSEIPRLQSSLSGMNSELPIERRLLFASMERVEKARQQAAILEQELAKKEGDECSFCGGSIKDSARYMVEVCRALGVNDASSPQADLQKEMHNQEEHAKRVETLEKLIPERDKELAAACCKEGVAKRCKAAVRKRKLLGRAAELEALVPSRQDMERLAEMERMVDELYNDSQAKAVALSEAKSQHDTAVKMVEELTRECASYERSTAARSALSEIRDALSQARAQARYMRGMIDSLNHELAMDMQATGLPFSLRLDTGSRTFVFTTQDGVDHPAVHLSGAQRAMCAVAFQMALFSVMRPRMNLYVIDEPTEALDDSNKRVMAGLFARINDMLPQVNGTMLIVTRDVPVIESCGNVIEVGQ